MHPQKAQARAQALQAKSGQNPTKHHQQDHYQQNLLHQA
jgi:hypothetical protein